MTDLEMTKLCAAAMGFRIERITDSKWRVRDADGDVVSGIGEGWKHLYRYDPLTDDAQAMALVRRFQIDLSARRNTASVFVGELGQMARYNSAEDADTINRAIVECVAKMRQERATTQLSSAPTPPASR